MASFNPLIFEKMSEHYESLLQSGKLTDVALVAGKKELHVHKLVLSARSPVFSAMFSHESTKEAQENRVEIDNVNAEILELLVRYIYTGKVETLDQYATDLLVAAHKYRLDSLKTICEQQLLSEVITTESVSDLLILADMHQATELTSKCLDYITDNGTQVMALEGWKKLRVKLDLVDKLIELFNSKYSKLINGEKKETFAALQNTKPFKLASFDSLIFEEMSKQYESLLENGIRSDVALVAGEKVLRAHKVILSARSPVFAAMFSHKSTKEAQENRVEIVDVDVEVVEMMLRYIYTGKVGLLDRYAAELLVAADKYQIDCLKTICEQRLLSEVIIPESVSDLLILADMHGANELTAKCLDYITDNGTQVIASEGWKRLILVKPDLVARLFENLNLKYTKAIQKEVINNVNVEKKVEPKKEESCDEDNDMGFGLFD